MGYLLKEDIAKEIKSKYKSNYLKDKIGISPAYVSLIVNRKKDIPKRIAYSFAKAINSDYEIEDIFNNIV